MPVPLYTCGLAVDGYDDPFHAMDLDLSQRGIQELHVSGGHATFCLMFFCAKERRDAAPYPMPFECPNMVREHVETCGPQGCGHVKQCAYNGYSWRNVEQQKKFPYVCRLSDRMAQRLIDFHLSDIDVLRDRLSQELQSHGDAVLRRWRKMSKDKRGSFLSAVSTRIFGNWPVDVSICDSEGCYAEHFHRWRPGKWLNSRDFAEDWMKLISVLHVRTAYGPADWAAHDLRVGVSLSDNEYFPTWFNDRCVVMCGTRFGQLSEYDSDALHANTMVGFPRALMTFQAQHELLNVLNIVLRDLLKDIGPTGSGQWSSLVANGLHSAGRDVAWNSYIHQAFTAPLAYSADDLYRKSVERLDMVKDELMLLQTDPAYAQEIIKSRRLAFSNASSGFKREQKYEHISGFLVLELLRRFEMWHTIASRCRELVEATSRSDDTCSPGSIMPPEVVMNVEALKASVMSWRRQSSDTFEYLMRDTNLGPRSVSLSQCSDLSCDKCPREVLDPRKPADRLKWHIKVIYRSAFQNERDDTGCAHAFEIIEREESSAQVMDQPTREYINDMMTLDELLTRVTWTQQTEGSSAFPPWIKSGEGCCILADPKCRPSKFKFQSGCEQRIGALTLSLMEAPWPKGRKDLSWLAKATLTRDRLAKLWHGISTEYDKAQKASGTTSACGTYFMTSMTEFTKDPAYVAQLAEERELCELESRKLSLIAEEKAKTLVGYVAQTQWGVDSVEKQGVAKKIRTKTKWSQAAHDLIHELGSMQLKDTADHSSHCCHNSTIAFDKKEAATPALMPIAVKKENLAIFQKMYRANTETSQSASIRWPLFIQAMKDAGFAAEESAGSAVSFRSNLGGSICFHRPHPDPVLHPIMLYAMAKRLTKWFGFNTETFVLRETEVTA